MTIKTPEEYEKWKVQHDYICKQWSKKFDRYAWGFIILFLPSFLLSAGPVLLGLTSLLVMWIETGSVSVDFSVDEPAHVRAGLVWAIATVTAVVSRVYSERKLEALTELHDINRERIDKGMDPLPY